MVTDEGMIYHIERSKDEMQENSLEIKKELYLLQKNDEMEDLEEIPKKSNKKSKINKYNPY